MNTQFLDAVASMDLNRIFYFVSTRSYSSTASTIYSGTYSDGNVTGVELAAGVSPETPGVVDFDAEISADGNTLYFSEGLFGSVPVPRTARIMIARRRGANFVRDPNSDNLMRNINTQALNYAADTSRSETEIFFTRLEPGEPGEPGGPAIYQASRSKTTDPFGIPQKITAITGFAEAPLISP